MATTPAIQVSETKENTTEGQDGVRAGGISICQEGKLTPRPLDRVLRIESTAGHPISSTRPPSRERRCGATERRIYRQTFIDTSITPADTSNDRLLPFFEGHEIPLYRVLTDRGTEYCGSDQHEYEPHLAVGNIEQTRTKTESPQNKGTCERFNKPIPPEFYRTAFPPQAL